MHLSEITRLKRSPSWQDGFEPISDNLQRLRDYVKLSAITYLPNTSVTETYKRFVCFPHRTVVLTDSFVT